MDRNNFAARAAALLSWSVTLSVGCDALAPAEPKQAQPTRPAILRELQNAAPGPWRIARRSYHTPTVQEAMQPGSQPPLVADTHILPPSTAPDHAPPLTQNVIPPAAGVQDSLVDAPVAQGPWIEPNIAPVPEPAVTPSAPPTAPETPVIPPAPLPSSDVAPLEAPAPLPQNESETSPLEARAPRTQLPWARSATRTPEMAAVAQRAEGHVRRGLHLAQRGAMYSARAEFVSALQLLANANDAQRQTQAYTKALSAGLTALRESNDFVSRPNAARSAVDVARVVRGHQTPLLKDSTPLPTATQAASRYYTYAQEQLAIVAADEIAGSMALFGLGKAALAAAKPSVGMTATAQAMALYQAALMADSNNFLAANELAVLLAETGNLPRARDLLVDSVRKSSQAASWQNLAVIHSRLGETQLAEQASARASAARLAGQGLDGPQVQWMDPATFAQSTPVADHTLPSGMAKVTPSAAPPTATKPPASVAKNPPSDWVPWRR